MTSQLTQITIKIPAPAFGSHNSKSTRFKSRNNTGISFIVILLFTLLNLHNDFNGNWMTTMMPMLCMAGPMPTSLVLPPTSQSADSSMVRVVNLTRQHGGDIFTAFGKYILQEEKKLRSCIIYTSINTTLNNIYNYCECGTGILVFHIAINSSSAFKYATNIHIKSIKSVRFVSKNHTSGINGLSGYIYFLKADTSLNTNFVFAVAACQPAAICRLIKSLVYVCICVCIYVCDDNIIIASGWFCWTHAK